MTDGRWADALFHQTQQLRFLESETGRRYMEVFEYDFARRRGHADPGGPLLRDIACQALRSADPVYVSGDVTEMIDVAKDSFQPEVLLPTDPFVQCGFAFFARSIIVQDRNGSDNGVRAMMWMPFVYRRDTAPDPMFAPPEQDGVYIMLFSHFDDPSGSKWDPDDPPPKMQHGDLTLLHAGTYPFHRREWESVGERDEVVHEDSVRQLWVLPQVTWRIAQQLVAARERAPRHTRRDAHRHGVDKEDVSVLTLRRERNRHYEEGEGKDHDHRWMVRGHWRNQWYPSLRTHRQVWINPYVKGPDDKPLVVKRRVVEFVR